MAAVLVTSVLLVGLSVVVRQLSASAHVSPWERFQARYDRAMRVLDADVRGLVRMTSLPPERSEHGRPIAAFITTHRIDSISERGWRGSAHVSYWIEQTPMRGQQLWRAEAGTDSPAGDSHRIWMPLISGLDRVLLTCRREGEWGPWPRAIEEDDETDNQRCQGVKIKARRAGDAARRPRELMGRSFKPFGRQIVELGDGEPLTAK